MHGVHAEPTTTAMVVKSGQQLHSHMHVHHLRQTPLLNVYASAHHS